MVDGTIPRLVVLVSIRKQVEQAMGNKLVMELHTSSCLQVPTLFELLS